MNSDEYWSDVADSRADHIAYPLWRDYCDALHARLLHRWLEGPHFHTTLKTDLFDEAHGQGMARALSAISDDVVGIDVSQSITRRAAERHPGIEARTADVRQLPLDDGCIDFVFSNSSLDHFEHAEDLHQSLREIHRVMAPDGRLLLTLDNPCNPVVGLRNKLPSSVFGKSALLPYFVGHTLALAPLIHMLDGMGFTIQRTGYILHVPRIVFLHLCRFFSPETLGGRWLLRFMLAFDALADLPTAPLTGHYVAVLARKKA